MQIFKETEGKHLSVPICQAQGQILTSHSEIFKDVVIPKT